MALTLITSFTAVPARGELPTVTQNPDATRTVAWAMNDSAALTAQNISFSGGNASLAWTPVSMTWSRGSDFETNASLWTNLSAGSSGVSLAANGTNRLADPDFSSPGTWTYVNGSRDNTTAQWDGFRHAARLNHTSGQTQFVWDSLSSILGNWGPAAWPPSSSIIYQASGAMGDFVNVSGPTPQFAGALHVGPVDWSAYDQFRMDLYMNASAPAAFNISALNSTSAFHTTTAIPLTQGWQTVTANLSELGSDRASLNYLTLRIVDLQPQKLPPLSLLFMDIELGKAKVANTTARVTQLFDKANTTTAAPGSAYLSFDWVLENITGVAGYQMNVTLSGPSGTFESLLPHAWNGSYTHFFADVSPDVVDPGTYNLTFALRVFVDNITVSNVTAFVDNAAFVYPNRGNGMFDSIPLSFGADSRFSGLTWSATAPTSVTSVELAFRTGATPSTLGPWQLFDSPGTVALSDTGLYFQMRAYLNTTNASATPVLASLSVSGSHHLNTGVIVSGTFTASTDFLHWRSFNATGLLTPYTFVSFWVGNGTYWTPVSPGQSLSFLTGPELAWRAILTTYDGLQTPSIRSVEAVYDFLGTPVSIAITPGGPVNLTQGQSVSFSAQVLDAGAHPVTYASLTWSTTDPSGHVDNTGTYTAGSVGDFKVTATVSGMVSVTQSVDVHVTAGLLPNSGGSPWDLWLYAVMIGAAAVLGFGIYEVAVRRLFAIDDVFLISKDGRLIMHNTRRMRADRDEDILSGMLTAIMAFLRDQDPEENGELKRFEVGGKTTLLERGEHVYLAAIYSGRVPGWAGKDLHRFIKDLEDDFGESFAEWTGSPEDLRGLKEYMVRFVAHLRYHSGPRNAGKDT